MEGEWRKEVKSPRRCSEEKRLRNTKPPAGALRGEVEEKEKQERKEKEKTQE
jgi:hypothetical protein